MKVRIRFGKLGKVRWTSHRDVARMWERAFRRVELPLAYTGGYSPRPKVSFGLALPTGHESVAEYLDVELDPERIAPDLDTAALPDRLTPALPAGIDVLAAAPLDEHTPSLQDDVSLCRWEIDVYASLECARGIVDAALAAPALVIDRERKGRVVTDDIRPGIRALAVLGTGDGGTTLAAELATQPRTVRPSELILAIGQGLEGGLVRRTHQWSERDGARREPIPLDATRAPHALWERAS
jgi:radical SAM-linked protein